MPNENVQLKKGLSSNLPSTYTPGDILFETDTGNMYVDVTSAENSSQRVQVKDDTKMDKWATVSGGSTINSLTNSKDNLQINADGYISLYSPLVRIGAGEPQILTISSSSATVSGNLKMNRGKQIQFTDQAGNSSTFMSTSGTDTSTIWTLSTPGTIRFNPSGLSISISKNGIDMGSSGTRKITNLIAPTAATDATNKQYVDGLYQNLESEIVTTASQYLPLKGGTMTGSIDMGNYLITSLGAPQSDTDATNKQYVDTKMDKWGDIQDLGGSGAPLIIKPQDQSNLGTPTTKFGISLNGNQYDGLFLSSTGHTLQSGGVYLNVTNSQAYLGIGSVYLSASNSGVSLICDGGLISAVSVSPSGVIIESNVTSLFVSDSGASLNNNLSVGGIVDCNTLSLSATTENGISLTEISSGLLGISSSGDVVIRGVASPAQSNDAANKQYVDNALSNVSVQWSNVSSKPFTSIGTGLQVSGNVLSVNTSELVIDDGSLS